MYCYKNYQEVKNIHCKDKSHYNHQLGRLDVVQVLFATYVQLGILMLAAIYYNFFYYNNGYYSSIVVLLIGSQHCSHQ